MSAGDAIAEPQTENAKQYQSTLPDVFDNSGWELVLERDGITIYTRDWPGSDFVAIKTMQDIQSTLSNIIANFVDVEQFPEWVEDMRSAHVVEPFDELNIRKVYMRIGLPWPLIDRDTVLGQQLSQDAVSKQVKIREWNEGANVAETPGVMRIPRVNSEFILVPQNTGVTRMIWQGHNEPGGYIPSFLVNWMVENIFYKSAMSMRERFESPMFLKSMKGIENF
jgi:hypothetical protein